MTRHDVANLVIRTFALWLGVVGVTALVTLPWLRSIPGEPAPLPTALMFAIPLAAGVVLWQLAPWLAGTVFDRSSDAVPYAITPDGVPPLASFVVGLVVLAIAVPQAMSWMAMQWMRSHASLMTPDLLPSLDQQSAGIGAEVVARIILGAVLIAISRRPGLWATPAIGDADESSRAMSQAARQAVVFAMIGASVFSSSASSFGIVTPENRNQRSLCIAVCPGASVTSGPRLSTSKNAASV